MVFARSTFLAALFVALASPPAGAVPGEPGGLDRAAAAFVQARTAHLAAEPARRPHFPGHARTVDGAPTLRGLWDDYYAQKVHKFSGDLAIDIQTGAISGTVRVEAMVTSSKPQNLYFMTGLPITQVTDGDGNVVATTDSTDQGVKLTRIPQAVPPEAGTVLTYVFTMSGTPSCAAGGALQVNICSFVNTNQELAYLAMELFLPSSIAGDFSTLDLRFTLAKGQVVASSGLTTEVLPGLDADHEIHHVVQDFPTDSHSMAVAEYQVASLPWGSRWIRAFTRNNILIQSRLGEVMTDIQSALEFHGGRYGDFVFPKMEAVEVSDDTQAAMGWPALLWIPDSMWSMDAGGTDPYMADERRALFAHELAHQWFPDGIMMDDPQGPWLSEGFAEFSSVEFMGSRNGADYSSSIYNQYGLMYEYFVRPASDYGLTSSGAASVTDANVYQVVTYYKGAVVASTIRNVIGQDTFLKAIGQLYADKAGKEAYYDTRALQKYFEDAYGKPLDWLFNEWVYGKGFPIYTVTATRVTPDDAPAQVKVRVQRSSNIAGTAFTMPVTLTVVTDKGETNHAETVDQDDMTFTYDVDGRFLKMRFDPQLTFIRRVLPGFEGDVDLSGEVDGIDLLYGAFALNSRMFRNQNFISWVDFNADGKVDQTDFDHVLNRFGTASDMTEVAP